MGAFLGDLLQKTFGGCKYIGDVRGRGLFWTLEFVQDKETKRSFNPSVAFSSRFYKNTFELGLAVYPCVGTFDGVRGDHIIISPPYVITELEVKEIARILKVAYDDLEMAITRIL